MQCILMMLFFKIPASKRLAHSVLLPFRSLIRLLVRFFAELIGQTHKQNS